PKGRTRARMAERLLDLHGQGRLRVAIGRASNYYGPGGLASVTGERLFRAAVAGRTVRWVGRLDQPHTLSYLEDVAAGLATLGEREEADGQAWHLPAAEALTGRHVLELVVAARGGRPRRAPQPRGRRRPAAAPARSRGPPPRAGAPRASPPCPPPSRAWPACSRP